MLALVAAWVLLAASGGNSLDLPNWAQWGILGAGIVALATGKFLVPAYLYKAEKEAREAAEERERALLSGVITSVETALRETKETLVRLQYAIEARSK